MSYYLTAEAHEDLVGIALHTFELWGAEQERAYVGGLFDRFHHIAANPAIGRACDDLRPGLRRIGQGSHVIFFRRLSDHRGRPLRAPEMLLDPGG